MATASRSDRNIERCPKTWSICQKIPGLITVMFSIFEPGKHLPPHRGPYNGVLRLHLGLIVPEPREQLGIRVEKDIYRWKEGEAVVFDDAYEHEAWNYTPQTRVVLFVDFRKPLRFPANFLNWLLLHLAVCPPSSARACTTRRPGRRNSTRKPRRYGIAATRLDLAADHA